MRLTLLSFVAIIGSSLLCTPAFSQEKGGDDRTGGSPITITDFGLRNDGGLFSRRLRSFSLGNANAGMY